MRGPPPYLRRMRGKALHSSLRSGCGCGALVEVLFIIFLLGLALRAIELVVTGVINFINTNIDAIIFTAIFLGVLALIGILAKIGPTPVRVPIPPRPPVQRTRRGWTRPDVESAASELSVRHFSNRRSPN